MTNADDDWKPRPDDHLVEPFFGPFVEDGDESDGDPAPRAEPAAPAEPRPWWRRLLARLGLGD